ncbi:Phytanoyl-CoA dioxygenase [Teratosphaeria destructans]|uniref:Phytanoyl-CoA dioxygenase n=1 Tax=Teratosphaeria destructans TaxID=418781 RepID=A0A9W7SN11_9PEZI|nr:Phytanoyl-CoA dioxygenase [Teratosphaeria destructans]
MPSSSAAQLPSAQALRAALDKDGFVRIPKAFDDDDVDRFRAAATRATERARAGQWPYVRTVPKQFPPWPIDEVSSNGIWGVQHLLHPGMPPQDRRVFAESYFSDTMLSAVTALLDCHQDDLVMELYNMLVAPPRDFALRWHRDDIGPHVSVDEEIERLKEPMIHAQWNLALYPDSSLVVVPGSHKRPRTDMERSADPYEDDMPGQLFVKMEPGDIIFYNNNILHRGVYDSRSERMTLHGTMGVVGGDGVARARNILQHGIGTWAAKADFTDLPHGMAKQATAMQSRLIAMGSGEGVGFSQTD